MRHHTVLFFTFLAAFLAFATLSRADTDAYFCTSKGYLAYEAREGTAPGVVGHVLRVMGFEPERGIYLAGEVMLPESFTVYHLICREDTIEISGWLNVVTKYVIGVAKSRDIRMLTSTDYPGQRWSDAVKDGPAPADLGIFGPKLAPLSLESLDPEHEYELLRSLSWRQTKEGPEVHSKSELVQLDPRGNVLRRVVLYESRRVESGD
jgi:hypothetical protein